MLDARTRRLLDIVLVCWAALWLLVGVAIWHEVRGLRPLADTVGVLRGVASIPLIGGSLRRVADDASRTAASAQLSARRGRRSVDRLAIILGIVVPAVAILPVGLAYALLRPRR
jgi:beta-lactamase regulating signal transducer with metallopeptidase domain